MDNSTTKAIEAIAKAQAGIIVAIATFAEALIKEDLIAPERLIEHLESPSRGLQAAGLGPAEMAALNSVVAFLKQNYATGVVRPSHSTN